MDNYQAMDFYYGLLNLHAGLFRANLGENLRLVAQSVPETSEPAVAYHTKPSEQQTIEHDTPSELEFGSFYDDGHILHNVKIETQSDFFLDPTRGDAIKWHVSFTVAKDVRPADQFIVQLSDNLIVAPNGHPQKPIPDYVDQDGVVIAMGEYQPDKHQLVYTFTNYVTDHERIFGEINGELTIDPLTVPETEFGMKCFIAIDNYRREFTVDADYPDLSGDTFLGISSRMMSFDADKHIFTDLIYVNPAEKQLDHGYVVFNTSEMVEELSNAVVTPATIRLEVFQNARHLQLPQSYGVDLRRLRDITNRFPVAEGDHLVDTPLTVSFADNKMRLNFADSSSTDSYVIRVTGQYNDELEGAVRLRARLFGVDQTNVYMSNSTAATMKETAMTVTGSAVAKEESAPTSAAQRDLLYEEGATVDELATTSTSATTPVSAESEPAGPTVAVDDNDELRPADATTGVQDDREETVDSSAYVVNFDDSAATADEGAAAESAVVDEDDSEEPVDENVAELESENATDYDRRFAKLLKKNMAKVRRGEKVTVEPVEDEELAVTEATHIIALQPTEVFLPQSNAVVEEAESASASAAAEVVAEQPAASEEPAPESATVVESAATSEPAAPTEVFTPTSSAAESVVVEEPIVAIDSAAKEQPTPAPVVEVIPEEEPAANSAPAQPTRHAPLPMPTRRPPRRVGRFERYPERSSLRHLRRR